MWFFFFFQLWRIFDNNSNLSDVLFYIYCLYCFDIANGAVISKMGWLHKSMTEEVQSQFTLSRIIYSYVVHVKLCFSVFIAVI